MLGSSYAWSQSDLEDLQPSSSSARDGTNATNEIRNDQRNPRRSNGYSSNLPPADNQELSISLDFLKNSNEDDHLYHRQTNLEDHHPGSRVPSANDEGQTGLDNIIARTHGFSSLSQQAEGQIMTDRGRIWLKPSSATPLRHQQQPGLARQLSLNTSTKQSEYGTPPFPPPFSPFFVDPTSPFAPSPPNRGPSNWTDHSQGGIAKTSWYRTTSSLVEASDPVVYSSSNRSNRESSLGRRLSREGAPLSLPPSSPTPASLRSSVRSASEQASSGATLNGSSISSDSSFKEWSPEVQRSKGASAAVQRSLSASRPQQRDSSPGFVSWSTPSEMPPQVKESARSSSDLAHGRKTDAAIQVKAGRSPSLLDEFGGSPRVLETMPEGIEPHAASQSHVATAQSHHGRLRSTSTTESFRGGTEGSEGSVRTTFSGDTAASQSSSPHKQCESAAQPRAIDAQRPANANWTRESVEGGVVPVGGEEGEVTARQSPIESRGGTSLRGISNHSPFRTSTFMESDEGGVAMNQPVNLAATTQYGTESRRHSIAAIARVPVASGAQRRAVGFELRDSAVPTRSVSVDRDRLASLETDTPRSRTHIPRPGHAGFSEDDLAADLGQLQVELDRISTEQKEADARGLSINLRMPSSQAAATGMHPASMPPLFGTGEQNRLSGSSVPSHGWEAALPPHSPPASSLMPAPSHLLSAPQTKSRSASMGPTMGGEIPSKDRSFARDGASAATYQASDSMQPDSKGPSTSPPSAYRLSPQAQSFNIGSNVNQRWYGQQQYHALPPPPRSSDPRDGIASIRFGGGLLPGPLRSPSAAGAVESGITASIGVFSPMPFDNAQSGGASEMDRFPPGGQHHFSADQQRAASGFQGHAQAPFAAAGNAPIYSPAGLNAHTFNSLASLGAIPTPSGAGGPASLQDLGRGVPLSSLSRDTPLYIVGFKQGRTDLFFKPLDHNQSRDEIIRVDDLVIVEADRGKDIGRVVNDSITVDQVGSFLSSQGAASASSSSTTKATTPATRSSINPKRLYSKASPADTSLLASKASDEEKALLMCIQKVQQRNLPMRVISAELQWDRRKLTFYYIASSRVDFRALVADLFKIWKVRIYMSQIPGPEQDFAGAAAAARAASGQRPQGGAGAGQGSSSGMVGWPAQQPQPGGGQGF